MSTTHAYSIAESTKTVAPATQVRSALRVGTNPASVCLKAEGISLAFGGQQVLKDVSLELGGGQIALLRGANGCGKTTLLNILSGFLQPDSGRTSLEINGRSINLLGRSPDCLVRLGIARLWQDIRLFPTMTALENVLAASPHAMGINPAVALFAYGRVKRQEQFFREEAMHWLELLGMADRAHSSGDKLSIGQSKRIAIARLLQTDAQVLLLDEPLAGLDHASAKKLVHDLNRLADTLHKALLVVEHNHDAITPVCDICFTLCDTRLHREELEGLQWAS